MLPAMQPVPVAAVPRGTVLRIVGAAGAGFPSPAQDWEDDAISLIELLRLDRAASFVFRISGNSMIEAGRGSSSPASCSLRRSVTKSAAQAVRGA